MAIALVALIALVVAGAVFLIRYAKAQRAERIPPEIRAKIDLARASRAEYHSVLKIHEHEVWVAQRALQALVDPRGPRITTAGGVTLYERWIETPQGRGSIIGVTATAEDDSSVGQRLTATRLLAVGVFALAAPKRTVNGNAYVAIEGPHVSGVAVFPASKRQSPGQQAFTFAARVNNAADQARVDAAERLPTRIATARVDLAAAMDTAALARARQAYGEAVDLLPGEYGGKFATDLEQTEAHPDWPLAWDRLRDVHTPLGLG